MILLGGGLVSSPLCVPGNAHRTQLTAWACWEPGGDKGERVAVGWVVVFAPLQTQPPLTALGLAWHVVRI